MLRAYKNIGTVRQTSFFKTWLIKILINECNTFFRKQKKESMPLLSSKLDSFVHARDDFSISNSSFDFDMLLKVLNYEERQVIILFYSCDFSIKDICQLTGVNENTVKTRMSRAKTKIKKMLGEGGQANDM
jgi:RNA polymerase sigma-70 factor (ECF subfamily)